MVGLGFPFRLTTPGAAQDTSTVNAADNHIIEVSSLLQQPPAQEGGNVLAIVSFAGDNERAKSCDGKWWHDVHIRMRYETLMNLGSAKIREMLEPRRQERIRRRFTLTESQLEGIDYVVDFSPPTEGSELADLTAALWLPKVVKLWFLAGHYIPKPIVEIGTSPAKFVRRPLGDKAVGAILTLGHDDNCKNEACLTDLENWKVKINTPGIVDEDPHDPDTWKHIPAWRKIDDYCRVRHRAAIMRVLRAINGQDLLLNSAPRMWTIAQVAVHLEIPHVVVDPITQWLIAPPNTKFIEICPERAFQLAYALKIPGVLIPAFKILVAELAIDYAATERSPHCPALTWAERKRDDYGDFPSDPVDYASRAFADRMAGILQMLQSDNVFDRLDADISRWAELQALGSIIGELDDSTGSSIRATYRLLVDGLIFAFHKKVIEFLDDDCPYPAGGHLDALIEAQRTHYMLSKHRTPLWELYRKLNHQQKVLTPFFWEKLRAGPTSFNIGEYTYKGIQLWRITANFNQEFKSLMQSDSITKLMLDKPELATAMKYDYEFGLIQFTDQMWHAAGMLSHRILDQRNDHSIPFFLSDHLLLDLSESELNFLPIWADGLDDGSGGVFQDVIPPAEMGPSEPGPAYHTGWTATDSSTGLMTDGASTSGYSDLGMVNLAIESDWGTVARSLDANQSVTTTPVHGRVVAAPSDIASEQFSESDGGDYAAAMFGRPAAHQTPGQAIARYVESVGASEYDEDCDKVLDLAGNGGVSGGGDGGAVAVEPARVIVSALDGFGLEDADEDMDVFDDDDDDDGTSTLDGSDYDLV